MGFLTNMLKTVQVTALTAKAVAKSAQKATSDLSRAAERILTAQAEARVAREGIRAQADARTQEHETHLHQMALVEKAQDRAWEERHTTRRDAQLEDAREREHARSARRRNGLRGNLEAIETDKRGEG